MVRAVVLKPGVATHLCVADILQCVAKKSQICQSYQNSQCCHHIYGILPI